MPYLFSNVRTLPSFDVSSGGMPFSAPPPGTSFALVGLSIRAGAWIDQVTPIFAELLEDGHVGTPVNGPSYGGHGGVLQELRCAPGCVVTGIQTRSGSFVDAIRLLQTRWDGNLQPAESMWTPWVGGHGGVERAERVVDPSSAGIVIGLTGRAGLYVDNLTVVVGEPMRIAATPLVKASGRTAKATMS